MRIRLFKLIIVLVLLAVIATACSVVKDAGPGPSLAPGLTAVAGDRGVPGPVSAPVPDGADKAAGPSGAGIALTLPAETLEDAQAKVTVEVTPAGGEPGSFTFDVAMNTHSVELDYDMTRIATLRDDQGRNYPARSWTGSSGGHHQEGSLTFEVPNGEKPKWLELSLAGIGGASNRVLKWNVQ